jgi:GNAT superfamily N-acetyltransferase
MEAAVRTIRQLQPIELPLILDMAHKFFVEANIGGEFNDDTFMLSWTGFMKSGNGVIFILTEEDKIVGAIGGLTYRDVNTGKGITLETFWYVDLEYREKGVGAQLIYQLEQWARSMSCTRLIMAALMNKDFPKMEKFYGDKGFHLLEVNFSKEL